MTAELSAPAQKSNESSRPSKHRHSPASMDEALIELSERHWPVADVIAQCAVNGGTRSPPGAGRWPD